MDPLAASLLLVEDEPDLAESCVRLLRRRGHRVVVATSYEAGRVALITATPLLLVTDVSLPDGNGLDLVVTASTLAPAVPAVAMSGQNANAAAQAAGAVAFLTKPFALEHFAQTVDSALRRGATAAEGL